MTATGTTVRHTSPRKILDISIPIPSLEEQQQIVDHLEKETTKIE